MKRCSDCDHCKVKFPLEHNSKGLKIIYEMGLVSCKKEMWTDFDGNLRTANYITGSGVFGSKRRYHIEINRRAENCELYEGKDETNNK